jgi:predicted metal-dependent phosphoesterase TrpH/energy-coupling factor transporter ATP-binding protein EcfA2
MTEFNFSQGSLWRKWDLHFHSQSSYDYNDKSVTDEEMIRGLIDNGIKAIAITDHHKIDETRIKNLQTLGKGEILILPGIEFRSELGGSELMHFIGIFSENADINYIWKQIQVRCKIDDADIEKRGGYEKTFCDFKETAKIIHELGGLVSIHAGKKSNSLERLKNDIKDDLEVNKCIDILEVGNVNDIEAYYKIVFPNIRRIIPIVLCSDNHNIKEYSAKQNLWIKSDLTFEGLKQIIYEPEERVKIQEINPESDFEKFSFTEIEIASTVNVFQNETLRFEKNTIPLNQNLVTIIGGRGAGKSVLINYFANGFKQYNVATDKSAFNPSSDFLVRWRKSVHSSDEIFPLDKQHDLPFLFISQSEVKEKVKDAKDLGNEIKKILELETLSFDLKIDEIIQDYKSEYNANKEWFDKRDENNNPINSKVFVEGEIQKNKNLLERITTEENKEKLEKYSLNIEKLQSNDTDKLNLEQLKNDLLKYLQSTNERITAINRNIPFIDFKPQIEAIEKAILEIEAIVKSAKEENSKIREDFKDFKGDITSLLSNVERFKITISGFDRRNKEIEEKEKLLNGALENKKKIGNLISKELQRQKTTIDENWRKLLLGKEGWNPEQKELMKKIINNRDIKIEGEILFNKEAFYNLLKDQIDGRTFKGKNSYEELETLVGIIDLKTYIDFLDKIEESILKVEYYLRFGNEEFEKIFYELRTRSTYLYVQPKITYNGKSLGKISVGQRGTIYLCLKLATNIFSQTIIFDQPEDDLDNDFIFNDLINIFKEIKRFRQVIIVTHNANIVVNADAEQVIVATNNEEKLSYSSGSLENPKINQDVCNILEGGKVAFQQRRNKYNLN